MNVHPLIEKESENMAKGIVWNLDGLYQGHDDPTLDQDLKAVREKTERFASSFITSLYFSFQKELTSVRQVASGVAKARHPSIVAVNTFSLHGLASCGNGASCEFRFVSWKGTGDVTV